MIYSTKQKEIAKFNALSESASASDLGHDKEELSPNHTGFDGMRIEDYLGYNPNDIGIARSDELAEDPAYGTFFREPIVMEAFTKTLT